MDRIAFVTSNKHKLKEAKAILPNIFMLELKLFEIQSLDPKEVLAWKVSQIENIIDLPFIVEDTSLFLECFNYKAPGPLVKFFLEAFSLAELYHWASLKNKFKAKAITLVAFKKKGSRIKLFKGETKGFLVKPTCRSSFGWDPIFMPVGCSKTFAEMSKEGKNSVSMRGRALNKLRLFLRKYEQL